jgi:hypothetical protein
MQDKRLTKRLMDYWTRLQENKALPSWEKFNMGALSDIWGQCCVWRVDVASMEKPVRQYTFEYVGSSAQQALGEDLTGTMFISRFHHFPGARIAKRIDEVVDQGVPISDEGTFVNENSKVVMYRSCLLPFGTPDGKVTRVMLGLSWKIV